MMKSLFKRSQLVSKNLLTQKITEALANPFLLAISVREIPEQYISKPLQPGTSLNGSPCKAKNRRKRRII